MFLAGFSVGFSQGWTLALVILAVVPLLITCAAGVGMIMVRLTRDSQKSYGQAGAVAEEVISSMRTVAAFGGEPMEVSRYKKTLDLALLSGIKQSHATGIG